ncbi:MAG: ribosome maturation factor RimM [Clostridiales bacterium]|nr:ribosome maturation factor RimM [Clostridiales bacterium]
MDNYFEIGKIAGTHGIKGTLRIFPTTDVPERFELLKEVILEVNNEKKVCKIAKVAYHKNFVLLTLEEYNDINQVEGFKNGRILIPAEKALPLDEDEYYTRDLYDMDVYTDEGENLGKLTEVYTTGANDVYGVTGSDGKELLIPAIKQCILSVNVAERKMTVKLLEGLRE